MPMPIEDSGSQAIATLTGVTVRFGEVLAVDNLDLEVRRGEVLGLLGPNGAGKTTALRVLVGSQVPTAGSASIAGHNLASDPLGARSQLGFVPDGAPLYANLSARAHLRLVGQLHGLAPKVLEAEAERLLEEFGLGPRADDPVGTFSRGMRQKVALACAILPKPALLILDEPLSGLDAPTTAVIKELLRAWAERGGAVLYTSHLLDVVERVCDRMAILSEGKLMTQGSLEELRSRTGSDGSLESVFRAVTRSEDPAATAAAILGPS